MRHAIFLTLIFGKWLWEVITVTFFDKISYHGARVKIRSGMVRLLIPCAYKK